MAKFTATIIVDGKEKTITRTATNKALIEKLKSAVDPTTKTKIWKQEDDPKEGKGAK